MTTIRLDLREVNKPPEPWLDPVQVEALFRQDKIWVGAHRTTYRIEEMSDGHLANTHRFVRRHYYRWRLMIVYIERPMLAMEEAWFGHDSEKFEEYSPLPSNIRKTKLFKALDREMRKRGIEPLEV